MLAGSKPTPLPTAAALGLLHLIASDRTLRRANRRFSDLVCAAVGNSKLPVSSSAGTWLHHPGQPA